MRCNIFQDNDATNHFRKCPFLLQFFFSFTFFCKCISFIYRFFPPSRSFSALAHIFARRTTFLDFYYALPYLVSYISRVRWCVDDLSFFPSIDHAPVPKIFTAHVPKYRDRVLWSDNCSHDNLRACRGTSLSLSSLKLRGAIIVFAKLHFITPTAWRLQP